MQTDIIWEELMRAIILVHGIMGSKLKLAKETIWPPSLEEFGDNHYHRIAKLMNSKAVATDILYQYTSFFQIYGPIIQHIEDYINDRGGRRPEFWFDWRLDLAASADRLAQEVQRNCEGDNGADTVTIVAHSMGGLVSRYLLESGRYNNKSWFKKIRRFVAVCVPHAGAPIAVARALGLEGSTTIAPEDMKAIMNNPDFPAGFELFPRPELAKNVLVDVHAGAQDIFSPTTAAKFGLSTTNQSAAVAFQSLLGFDKRPPNVDYIAFAGTGLSTENAYLYDGVEHRLTSTVDGDGTVPHWSASYGVFDRLITLPGDHIKIMKDGKFRKAFLDILYESEFTMMMASRIDGKPIVVLSINKQDLLAEETIEVLLSFEMRTTRLEGRLTLSQATVGPDKANMELVATGFDVPVQYSGPAIATLQMTIAAPENPGTYVLGFDGTHRSSAETSATFFVRQKSIRATGKAWTAKEKEEGKPARKKSRK
jgi:pimeloyl-ACP methyl ester carboxylesterase